MWTNLRDLESCKYLRIYSIIRRVVLPVLSFVHGTPLSSVCFILIFVELDFKLILLLPVAFLWESSIAAIQYLAVMNKNRMLLSEAYLKQLQGCNFSFYQPSDLIRRSCLEKAVEDHMQTQMINMFSLKSKEDLIGTLDESILIWLVEVPDGHDTVPAGYAAYHNAYDVSHIFIRSVPEKNNTVQEFFLLHEVGHTLIGSNIASVTVSRGILPGLIAAIVFWPLLVKGTLPAMFFGAFIALIVLLRNSMTIRHKELNLWNEIRSDHFATRCLGQSKCMELKNLFSKYPLYDPFMNKFRNATRNAWLQRFLLDPSADDLPASEVRNLLNYQIVFSGCLILILSGFLDASVIPWSAVWTCMILCFFAWLFKKFMIATYQALNQDILETLLNGTITNDQHVN